MKQVIEVHPVGSRDIRLNCRMTAEQVSDLMDELNGVFRLHGLGWDKRLDGTVDAELVFVPDRGVIEL